MRTGKSLGPFLLAVAVAIGGYQPVPAAELAAETGAEGIVGSWRGTTGEGNAIIATFHGDGTFTSSVVPEVTLDPTFLTLTTARGVWRHRGGRRYDVTAIGLLYDVPPEGIGSYRGYLKARVSLRLARGDARLEGFDRVEIYDTEDNLLFAVPPGEARYVRIEPEPFD